MLTRFVFDLVFCFDVNVSHLSNTIGHWNPLCSTLFGRVIRASENLSISEGFTSNFLHPPPPYAGVRHWAQIQNSSNDSLPVLSTVLRQCVYQMGPGSSGEFRKTILDPVKEALNSILRYTQWYFARKIETFIITFNKPHSLFADKKVAILHRGIYVSTIIIIACLMM